MHRNGIHVLFVMVVAAVPTEHAAAQRACQSLSDENPRRGLPNSNKTIVADKVQIDHAQKPHFIKLFSETAQKGKARFEQCFRYEAEAENEVRRFHWPLAGISADRLRPGLDQRRSMNRLHWIDRDPQVVDSQVFAFEKGEARTKAWAAISEATSHAVLKPQKAGYGNIVAVAPDNVIPGLGQFLRVRNLPVSPALAFFPSQPLSDVHTLQESYAAPGLKVEVTSDARRTTNGVVIRMEIVASGPAAEKAVYVIPALRGLQNIQGPVSKLESYERFIKVFDQAKVERQAHQSKWTYVRTIPSGDLVEGAVFRVRHPITVEWEGERDCFLVSSYSPLALSYSLQQCALLLK